MCVIALHTKSRTTTNLWRRYVHSNVIASTPGPRCIKTMVTLQLMISLQSMVTIIDFLTLIGYGVVLLWYM